MIWPSDALADLREEVARRWERLPHGRRGDLAASLQIPERTIRRAVAGGGTIETVEALARALGVDRS